MAISTINQAGLNAPLTLTSPVLTTPNLGTPSALVLTNATGLPKSAMPSGSVIQTVYTPYSSSVATNSSTPVAIGPQISIVTTVANSKILVSISAPCQLLNTSDVTYTVSWRNSTDSYASNIAAYPAVISGGWYELPSHFQAYSTPGVAAGTTITYKIYVAKASGTGYLYLVDGWGTGYGNMPIVAMEIAP